MSFHWYPNAAYGVRLKDFTPLVYDEMYDAFMAVYTNDDLALMVTDDGPYLPRYAPILSKRLLNSFEGEPGELLMKAFASELECGVPDFKKVVKYASIFRVESDADACENCEPEDLVFGVGIHLFPLEKHYSRPGRLPKAFMDKAGWMLWAVGG